MREDERDALRAGSSRWRGPAGFAVLLLIASTLPVPSGVFGGGGGEGSVVPLSIGLTDPFHVVGYAILVALVTRVTGRTPLGLLLAVVAAVGFGFGIELVQAPVPWRTFAWRDVGVNALGAVIGAVVVAVGGRRRERGSR